VDGTPASRSFTVDTAAPNTTIDSGPSGLTNDATPTFAFSANQAGSTFECRVDGGAWAACTTPRTTASLADGPHTFEVRATDTAGNVDPTPALRAFVVETILPDTTIDSGPTGTIADRTPTFDFSADEPGSTFQCRIDGGAWASCSMPFTAPSLADGPHTLEVRAIDPAGNVDATPASRSFTVAATPSTPTNPTNPTTPANPGNIGPSGNPPAAPPAGSDLAALPGSLVAGRSCQRLGAGLRTTKKKIRGIGRVTVKIQSTAIVMADAPISISVKGPRAGKGRLRSVRYTLDGRALRGARRQPFTAAITPSALARVGRHALALKLKPKRGKAGSLKLGMRTLPCTTVFRAYQKRTKKGAQLKLRMDAKDAVSGTTFSVPSKMLPKGKAGLKVGLLRVVSTSGGSRSWNLAFGAQIASGMVLGGFGTPQVTVRGSSVSVTGLPAGTGIVEVYLDTEKKTRPAALVKRGRSVSLRGAVTGGKSQRLSYKLRGR
jgi:hypothetical protein